MVDAQHPRSDFHDEILLIVIHQTKELWLQQILREAGLATTLARDDRFAEAHTALSRVSPIQTVMTLSWDILLTLAPVDYITFRHGLGTSSGVQSAQFRKFEFCLGLTGAAFPKYDEGGSVGLGRLRDALDEPSPWDAFPELLWPRRTAS